MDISTYTAFLRWSEELENVISIKDLQLIARQGSDSKAFRLVKSLLAQGSLIKVKRGLYATNKATLATIAQRLYPGSYISTGTVLAKEGVIGSIPARRIQAVRVGSPRVFETPLGVIEFLSIAPKLFFGYKKTGNQQWALPEKAFLDVCYYVYKGKRFSFNPDVDVNRELLNENLLNKFLEKYDQRFVTFYRDHFSL
jgi:hypothetical protein